MCECVCTFTVLNDYYSRKTSKFNFQSHIRSCSYYFFNNIATQNTFQREYTIYILPNTKSIPSISFSTFLLIVHIEQEFPLGFGIQKKKKNCFHYSITMMVDLGCQLGLIERPTRKLAKHLLGVPVMLFPRMISI